MAFAFRATVGPLEFRGAKSGISKAGKAYAVVTCEDDSGRSCEFSVSDPDILESVRGLRKGDLISFPVFAFAGPSRAYVLVTGDPVVTGNAYGGQQ